MNNLSEKGRALELAVHSIETAILQSFPGYQDKTFIIESRKTIVVEGVKHEIDVWVEIDLGKGYKSVFIFECKNWESKVDKNQIIVFSEKINAVQAQAGFFVAKSFTRDARAQAKKDSRMRLLLAKEHPTENVPVPFDFHFVGREHAAAEVMLIQRGVDADRKRSERTLDVLNVQAKLSGNDLTLQDYIQRWTGEICDEHVKTFHSEHLPEGSYELEASSTRSFEPEELLVDGLDIASMHLKVRYRVRVSRPPIISHFEVEKRGRFLSLASVDQGGGTQLQVGFIQTS